MTAPTSRMTPEPVDPNDLRTALTKLADEWMRRAPLIPEAQVRALLAAHPARVVSDTRREDVALVETAARALFDSDYAGYSAARLDGIWAEMRGGAERADYFVRARAVLAVLPAPPAVDEATIRERIAQDIARAVGEGTASDIARGATR